MSRLVLWTLRRLPDEALLTEGDSRTAAGLSWLRSLRWIAVGAQLLIVPAGLHRGWLQPELLPPYAVVVGALCLFNLPGKRPVHAHWLTFELCVDVLGLAILLLLSGGGWNPLTPLLLLHISLAALLLNGSGSTAVIATVVGATGALSLYPPFSPATLLPGEDLMSIALVGTVLWSLVRWLSGTLEAHRQLLAIARERERRIDSLRALGVLATGYSHSLASPLNTLRLRLDRLCERTPADPDVAAGLEALDECEVILRVMAGTTLDPEQLSASMTPVGPLVERVVGSWAQETRRRVLLPVAEDGGTKVPPLPFIQSLLNLLDNAARASSDTPEAEIQIRVEQLPEGLAITVADSGPGWPPHLRKNLTRPFVTGWSGVGLGLYNVRTLAEALGGSLELTDRPGGGACATLTIPRSEAHA